MKKGKETESNERTGRRKKCVESGWEVGGIIDYISGSCWEIAWESAGGQLSVCAATLRITFHLPIRRPIEQAVPR